MSGSASAFDELWASLPRKRVGAGVLFEDEHGRVLVVKPTYKAGWEVPGGLVEVGESPRSAARREIAEELGIDVDLGPMLVCDWVPAGRRPDDGVMFLFAGGAVADDRIRLARDELSDRRWCNADELVDLVPAVLARRLVAARTAAEQGVFVELEDGYVVGRHGGRLVDIGPDGDGAA